MNATFGYSFPAIRGIQAGREYYTSMCPLRLLSKIFLFDEEELQPELRAQRMLNQNRVPEIARYILRNPGGYVFSAITASIDADVTFESLGGEGASNRIGVLHVPMDARFIINDGQHRRAAIEEALRGHPELGDESIAVVFFLDKGLQHCQQMFADLNRHAVRPSKSLGVLYDHRDGRAQLVRLIVIRSPFFRDIVEMERTTLAQRSRKLVTLSALFHATAALLDGSEADDTDRAAQVAVEYWEEVAKHFPEWQRVRDGRMFAGDVRRDYIHSHGLVLQALGTVGRVLLREYAADWRSRLVGLEKIDWSRANSRLWEGRAMIGGRLSKAGNNVLLTASAIKRQLGVELTPEDLRLEALLNRE